MGVGLELGIVRGDKGGDVALQQVRQDRTRQGSAFLWIGASAQFVQDDQRVAVCFFQDAHDVGEVPAEGTE